MKTFLCLILLPIMLLAGAFLVMGVACLLVGHGIIQALQSLLSEE